MLSSHSSHSCWPLTPLTIVMITEYNISWWGWWTTVPSKQFWPTTFNILMLLLMHYACCWLSTISRMLTDAGDGETTSTNFMLTNDHCCHDDGWWPWSWCCKLQECWPFYEATYPPIMRYCGDTNKQFQWTRILVMVNGGDHQCWGLMFNIIMMLCWQRKRKPSKEQGGKKNWWNDDRGPPASWHEEEQWWAARIFLILMVRVALTNADSRCCWTSILIKNINWVCISCGSAVLPISHFVWFHFVHDWSWLLADK